MAEAGDIVRLLPVTARASLDALERFAELESTSTWLKQQAGPPRGRFRAVVAEHQTAGRGRNEKIWLSPPSSGVCLSISYTFGDVPRGLPALTLAVGVGIAAALERRGARRIALKWPNDVIAGSGKLGGILTEVAGGGRTVVIGIGINVDLPSSMRYSSPTSWTSGISELAACMDDVPDRPELAAMIIAAVIESVRRFDREGLAAFRSSWQAYDWLRGKTVSVQRADTNITGVADGIDEDGALLVKTGAATERIVSGSVRLAACGEVCA